MRLMTWNINSLRLRLPLLERLVAELNPDVICLQETKTPDEHFPHDQIRALGFEHYIFKGMKSYNGVAILSRKPLSLLTGFPDWCDKNDCRHIAGEIDYDGRKLTIHNFYVPAGGDTPDAAENPKFAHKLAFLDQARAYFAEHAPKCAILVGDLNIAPHPEDVWSHKQLLSVVSHTPAETERHLAWENTGFVDIVRRHIPRPEKLYSWWSYRNRDWRKSNRGRRLDHIWATEDLISDFRSASIFQDARDWERPSDHVPVIADFK